MIGDTTRGSTWEVHGNNVSLWAILIENQMLYFSDGITDIISVGVLGGFYESSDDIR